MTNRRFESNHNQRWHAIVTYNGNDITEPIPLNYIEVEDPPELWFAGQGMPREAFMGRVRFGFYQVSVSDRDIDQCQNVPTAEVFIYSNPESTSYVRFNDARCYSYMIGQDMNFEGARELELSWTFTGTTVQGLDWGRFQNESNPEPLPLEPISWQKLGF